MKRIRYARCPKCAKRQDEPVLYVTRYGPSLFHPGGVIVLGIGDQVTVIPLD